MILKLDSAVYLSEFDGQKRSLEIGGMHIDWQGYTVGKISYLQLFTGTGIRVQVEENTREYWIHWGRLIEWTEVRK